MQFTTWSCMLVHHLPPLCRHNPSNLAHSYHKKPPFICCKTAMICLVDQSELARYCICKHCLVPHTSHYDARLHRLARYLQTHNLQTHNLTLCLILIVSTERQGDCIGEKHTQGHGPGSPLGSRPLMGNSHKLSSNDTIPVPAYTVPVETRDSWVPTGMVSVQCA